MRRATYQDEEHTTSQVTLAEKEGPPAMEALLLRGLLHHVQANTRLILGLLALQADQAGDPEAQRELGDLAARALGTAHERLDRAGGATVDLAVYLRELCEHLVRFHLRRGIDLTLTVEADRVAVTTGDAVTLGLIVNELVADGAGRAIPGQPSEIRVELRATARTGMARLTVAEEGRGLPERCCAQPGLELVEELAAQLGGELAIVSPPKQGTRAIVAFPLPAPWPLPPGARPPKPWGRP